MQIDWKKEGRGDSAEPLEAGVYEVNVVNLAFGTSLTKNPKIRVMYKTKDGKILNDDLSLSAKAQWRLAWFVGACGIDLTKLPAMEVGSEEFTRVLERCRGRRMIVTVTIDMWNGKPRNKIMDYAKVDDQKVIEDIEEVPDFIKRRGTAKTGELEEVPF